MTPEPVSAYQKEYSDWENLKKSFRFMRSTDGGEFQFDQQGWDYFSAIRTKVKASDSYQRNLPVYYPGAGSDITGPLAKTDASRFVFVDYLYVNSWEGEHDPIGYLIREDLPEIGAEITSDATEGELGNGGKRIVKFNWAGKEREIVFYAEDATKFAPPELKDGILMTVIQAPTPASRDNDSMNIPGWLMDNGYRASIYENLALGGFINWQPTDYLDSTLLGFERVFDGQEGSEDEYPIYQKISTEPNLEQLAQIDYDLMMSISSRDGTASYNVSEESLKGVGSALEELRKKYQLLNEEQKGMVAAHLESYLYISPEDVSEEYLAQLVALGSRNGITDHNKAREYMQKCKEIVGEVFPELKPEDKPES